MKVSFLEATGPVILSKTYSKDTDGNLITTPYPNVWSVTSHTEDFTTIKQLYKHLTSHAKLGHCMLKGNPTRDLIQESRKGSHDPSEDTNLIVFDFDGIPGYTDVKTLIKDLKLPNFSYITQYSASMGVNPAKGLSAHTTGILDKPYSPQYIKAYLQWINLTNPILQDKIKLTASGRGLWWPLDITVCQNDKIIFIADPVCKNGVKDTLRGKRWDLHNSQSRATNGRFIIPEFDLTELNRLKLQKLNELREAAGYDTRKATYNKVGVLSNPETATVVSERDEGEFIRVNLLGEHASWGHWYPRNNPEILFSFKDEPPVLLSKLDPDYYRQAIQRAEDEHAEQAKEAEDNMGLEADPDTGLHYLTFIDDSTDTFYIGTYDPNKDEIDLRQTKNRERVDYFLMEHDQPIPEGIQRWRYEMDFGSNKHFDPDNKFINQYNASKYMRTAERIAKSATPTVREAKKVPATIESLIMHMVNYEEETYERFLNWLACKIQHRTRIGTAWLFHGTEGTGKGTLFNYVLRPILGESYTNSCSLSDFESSHNEFIANCVLRLIDEANAESVKSLDRVRSKLWTLITEPRATVNYKFVQQYEATNYTDYLLFSNATIPIDISEADRRFNVAARQESPYPGLNRTKLQKDVIKEVQDFANYLTCRKADLEIARLPMVNQAKKTLAAQHMTSHGEICSNLRKGKFTFFLDYLPPNPKSAADENLGMYEAVLKDIMAGNTHGKLFIYGEVSSIFLYLTNFIAAKAKFTSMLKKNGMEIKRIRRNSEPIPGIITPWKITAEDKRRWNEYMTLKGEPTLRSAK